MPTCQGLISSYPALSDKGCGVLRSSRNKKALWGSGNIVLCDSGLPYRALSSPFYAL